MAKFLYKMQNILNIKYSMENQSKTVYGQAITRLNQEEIKLRKLIERQREYEDEYRRLSQSVLDISKIRRCNESIQAIKELIKNQIISVKIAERNLEAARNRLTDAMKERKTYEKLKENAFEDFKIEISADEKKEIDELVSFNYNDNNKETGE